MKGSRTKLLLSLALIGIVSTAAGAGTFAYFSDTETAEDNTLQAGTIDVAVDEQNPWTKTYQIEDIKPSYNTGWINYTITNNGTNPAKIYKHINVTNESDGMHPEPEPTGEANLNNVSDVIQFDLMVNGSHWIELSDDRRLSELESNYMYLGTLNPDESMTVNQSFHMHKDAGNEYQGDTMTFDEEIVATQTNAPGPKPKMTPGP